MLRRKFISGAGAMALGLMAGRAVAQENSGAAPDAAAAGSGSDTFSEQEIVNSASDFFGIAAEATAKVVQRAFRDLGQPNGYISGNEGSGAFVVGLRYGAGWLVRKNMEPKEIFWRGPSVGFDVGANASKVFTLVYNMHEDGDLYRRFPGVEGSYYFVAGIGVLYMRKNGVTVAPMRTGVGLRAGVNAQFQEFTPKRDWFPI